MNRTALSIQMLLLLKSHGKMKKREIAEALETNPRNIIEFKRELEVAGYAIGHENGPNGGYYLMDRALLPVAALTDKEKLALRRLQDYMEGDRDFLFYTQLKDALSKLVASTQTLTDGESVIHVIKRFPLAKAEQDMQDIYMKVHTAIQTRQKLSIVYDSLRSENPDPRIVHPYELFQYSDSWYMIAYSERRQRYQFYKLVRITEIENLKDKFRVDPEFDVSRYIDEYGMLMEGQKTRVKLKLMPPHNRLVAERILGEDQLLTHHEDYSILEVTMSGTPIIKQFILGMGTGCEVLEPIALRTEIQEEMQSMMRHYGGQTE